MMKIMDEASHILKIVFDESKNFPRARDMHYLEEWNNDGWKYTTFNLGGELSIDVERYCLHFKSFNEFLRSSIRFFFFKMLERCGSGDDPEKLRDFVSPVRREMLAFSIRDSDAGEKKKKKKKRDTLMTVRIPEIYDGKIKHLIKKGVFESRSDFLRLTILFSGKMIDDLDTYLKAREKG